MEDLVYIDDLQVIIYTTIAPKTSQIFITSMIKTENKTSSSDIDAPAAPRGVEIITLEDLTQSAKNKKAEIAAKLQQEKAMQDSQMLTNHY